MLLICLLQPRRDGNIIARVGGAVYDFRADLSGSLSAEVADIEHAEYLLATGNFVVVDNSSEAAKTPTEPAAPRRGRPRKDK